MSTAFVRQLGAEAGVQLNPLRDNSEIPTQDNYDQVIATALKATRGRIDKPFKVNRSNIVRKLGKGRPKRINALNESYLHVVEALNNGAYEAVVQRLVPGDAGPDYIIVNQGSGASASSTVNSGAVAEIKFVSGGSGYTSATIIRIDSDNGDGSGASATPVIVGGKIIGVSGLVGGSGYTAAPKVTIIDGGYGAQVQAAYASGVITGITINSGGDGYTGPTTVSITDSGGAGTGAAATVTKSDNVITGILSMPAGTGFKKTSVITVNNNAGGTGLKLKITSVSKSGAITGIQIVNGGSGYTGMPTIKIDGKASTGITFKKSQKVITGILVTNGGSNYTKPVIAFSGTKSAGSANAMVTATVKDHVITAINVIAGGSGYQLAPEVTILKGTSNGSGAKATAIAANGVITGVSVTAGGTGYTNGATVAGTFSGGGGAGAAATAVISGGIVTSVTVTNGGSGYTSNPTLTFPVGSGATFSLTKADGVLKSVTVVSGGGNYTDSVVRIDTNGGVGAMSNAILTPGEVTGITLDNPGSNYTSVPEIEIKGGGGGSGATAIATVASDGTVSGVTLVSGGSGYTSSPKVVIKDINTVSVSSEPPEKFLFAVNHLECFNDGIKISFWADEKRELIDGEVKNVDNDKIMLWLKDADDNVLYEFYGSLNPAALDDFGNSAYLPHVVSAMTDAVEVKAGNVLAIPRSSNSAYGYDESGLRQTFDSDINLYFTDDRDDIPLSSEDYAEARVKLQLTPHNYAYICNCGNESDDLMRHFAQLAYDTNRQFKIDVTGSDIDAVINKVENWNLGASLTPHLMHVYWTRFKSDDPTGVNGKDYYGTATLNAAYACARNAQTNARGFAPKNYPIAGRQWPVRRTGIVHDPRLTDQHLNALARAKINPVMFETYTGGGRAVFRDSLTSAMVESSLVKLTAVADMSTSIDDAVTRFAKDVEQLPMSIAVKRTIDFLKALFEGAQAAGWLVPSNDPVMQGAAFRFKVEPNQIRPYDRMDVSYWLRYDGTVRQIFVTQTLSL